jgi:hypothetical protein
VSVGSLAYRRNEAAILRGIVPEKYRRLLPYITGNRILEIGAAEGVLALLLVNDPRRTVTALELRPERHQSALALQAHWRAQGRRVDGCTMVCGDIRQRLDLLQGIETVVAVRAIYYLREDAVSVFRAVYDAGVTRVVLCGNANRARRFVAADGRPNDALGPHNYYASAAGMVDVLECAGYEADIEVEDDEGDPIVTGHR